MRKKKIVDKLQLSLYFKSIPKIVEKLGMQLSEKVNPIYC